MGKRIQYPSNHHDNIKGDVQTFEGPNSNSKLNLALLLSKKDSFRSACNAQATGASSSAQGFGQGAHGKSEQSVFSLIKKLSDNVQNGAQGSHAQNSGQ